jgi:hypothetical protein
MRWNSASYIVWHIDLCFSNEFSESQKIGRGCLARLSGNHSPGEDFLPEANEEVIGAIFVKIRTSLIHTRGAF